MAEAGFHIDIGEYKCIVFSDGILVSDDPENEEVFGLNCLYIDSGEHKILIDTGCGEGFQATAGHLIKNLEVEGIKCADIDRIIFTHGHVDHASGTFDSRGKPVFPNARYIASEKEWECWENLETNELQTMLFENARKNLLPIPETFDLAKNDGEVLPGINLFIAPGHTPGLVTVEISSDGERLFCIGDVIHSQHEFIDPEHLIMFDVTPEQAIETRARILADVAQSGVLVFSCHFSFPGLGHVVQKEGVYTWEPL